MPDDAPSMLDRYVGAMIGSALGDALGRLTEHIDYDTITHQFGPSGIQEPPSTALYTDDTQMAMATARALVSEGDAAFAGVMRAITNEYLRWFDTQSKPVNRRAPGVAVIDALMRIQRGVPSAAAGDAGANDSIVATRVHPVALRYRGHQERIVEIASETARITHGHPGAVSSSAAAALLVDFALSGDPPEKWLKGYVSPLRRWCPDRIAATVESIRTAESTVGWDPEDAMERHFKSRPGAARRRSGWACGASSALRTTM